jgi:hypothetical protein
MARISSYRYDPVVNDGDAWIGTESSNRLTRQFTAAAVANYLNIKGKISVSGQMVFKFSTAPTQKGEFTGPNDGDSLNSFTTLSISGVDLSEQQTANFVQYLVGSNILISEQNNLNEFGHYTINSYTLTGNNVYDLVLTNIGGNGNVVLNKNYDFAAFTISSGTGDKTFNFTQGSPSATWTIQHNLGKFPSATIVDTGDTSVLGGQIEYIDNNNLTITFGSAFAGKAFLN